jgi:hypothetical protein
MDQANKKLRGPQFLFLLLLPLQQHNDTCNSSQHYYSPYFIISKIALHYYNLMKTMIINIIIITTIFTIIDIIINIHYYKH